MAVRRPPTTFSDEISAADLAANSVGASELADNAVDTAAIAADAVTNAKVGASAIGATELASNAVTTAKITDANITAAKVASSAITKEKLAAEAIEVKPHIKPGVLYPSLNDKQIDGVTAMAASTTGPAGSTVASSKWGTVQSDGRMYYFTGIKGSKPINDPRIGAHFGVQRHKFKSLQILLDETAHHKLNVYSLDGREWCRAVSVAAESLPATEKINVVNNSFGEYLAMNNDGVYIEITGYFNDIHWIGFSSATRKVRYTLDEGSEVGTDFGHSSIVSPYDTARYTDNGSVSKFGINTHLGIHTIKIRRNAGDAIFANGFEFVAQDRFTDATCDYNNDPTITHDASTRIVAGMTVSGTGIPANATVSSVTSTTAFELSASTTGGAVTNGTLTFGEKSIDIPPQNVVSYGKKFAVSRAAHHYDPFVTMSYGGSGINASTLGGLIDTATSLGMENWKAGGSNYHRPWNGGRVVKWIASDGTIKTSVTVMPPDAQNMTTTASNPVSNAEVIAGTNGENINFVGTAIDHSLSEVARTFNVMEFGNGGANNNSSWHDPASATNLDVSGGHKFSYAMTDNLTTLTSMDSKSVPGQQGMLADAQNDYTNLTFIGTGISFRLSTYQVGHYECVMNAPYGTHAVRVKWTSTNDTNIVFDGIDLGLLNDGGYASYADVTFYQPKKPPVPDDACIIADYMLMADWVNLNVLHASGNGYGVSKGARWQSVDRDIFWEGNASPSLTTAGSDPNNYRHKWLDIANHADNDISYPAFADIAHAGGFNMHADNPNWKVIHPGGTFNAAGTVSGNADTSTQTFVGGGNGTGSPTFELSNNKFSIAGVTANSTTMNFDGFWFNIPIHTSHHYQPFESPFTLELIGGDRNMEQTNLICSADGKTWDELTRDTSYIGIRCGFRLSSEISFAANHTSFVRFSLQRGGEDGERAIDEVSKSLYTKGVAYSYDRVIILEDGSYQISFGTHPGTSQSTYLYVNDGKVQGAISDSGNSATCQVQLFRGDFVQRKGGQVNNNDDEWNLFEGHRIYPPSPERRR